MESLKLIRSFFVRKNLFSKTTSQHSAEDIKVNIPIKQHRKSASFYTLVNIHLKKQKLGARYYSTSNQDLSARFRCQGEIESISDLLDVLDGVYSERENPLLKTNETQAKQMLAPVNRRQSLWFRGQGSTKWELSPGLFRQMSYVNWQQQQERQYLDESSALLNLTAIRPELRQNSWFDILAIAQHQNLPTRLLDWSQSALTSLLFAVNQELKSNEKEKGKDDAELFIMNPYKLNYHTLGLYQILPPDHPEVKLRVKLALSTSMQDLTSEKIEYMHLQYKIDQGFNSSSYLRYKYEEYKGKLTSVEELLSFEKYVERELSLPVAAYPLWKDARLAVQQGMFVIYGGKQSFPQYTNIKSEKLPKTKGLWDIQNEVVTTKEIKKDPNTFLMSYRIPGNSKYRIYRELRRLGINESLLFPELEYQSKYMRSLWLFPDDGVRKTEGAGFDGASNENNSRSENGGLKDSAGNEFKK